MQLGSKATVLAGRQRGRGRQNRRDSSRFARHYPLGLVIACTFPCKRRAGGGRTEAGVGYRPMTMLSLDAEPASIALSPVTTALVLIDMQRDFLEPGGFGETLGNDVARLAPAVDGCRRALDVARAARMLVIHTREGHRADLSDAPPAKIERGAPSLRIGDAGPMGRILIRGEAGHDIVDGLAPAAGEPVIDKPGKGAFYQTDLELMLRNRGIDTLLVGGVTTEVCVHTTIREANDRGFRCVALADACGSYFPEFHRIGLEMIKAQGGIFGWVSDSTALAAILETMTPA